MTKNPKTKLKILFMGTPEFAVPSLRALVRRDYSIVAVVTAPDKPAGRGKRLAPSPVKEAALAHGLAVLTPEKLTEIRSDLEALTPHLIVVVAYGKLLPSWILALPPHGAINVHPSLLPKLRGPSPIQYAILANDSTTGVSIILMNERMDEGPIIAQREFSISNFQFSNGKGRPTAGELRDILAKIGAELLIEIIPKWIQGKIAPVAQNDTEATYSKIITKKDGRIDWTQSAEEIERKIRAFDPWPGTFSFFEQKILKILAVEECGESDSPHIPAVEKCGECGESDSPHMGSPHIGIGGRGPSIGEVFLTTNKKVAVQTGAGHLVLKKVQLEGKRATAIKDFIQGYPNFIGTILQ